MSGASTPPTSRTPPAPATDLSGSGRPHLLSDTPPSRGSPVGLYRGHLLSSRSFYKSYLFRSINIINTMLALNKGKL